MAKNGRDVAHSAGSGQAAPAVAKIQEKKFAFKSPVRCPRCGAMDTLATKTEGQVQHRKCRRAVCLHTFKVIGDEA